MSKLYFKYGAMGSSKTAQALMCRFNYMQKGFNVFLIKPSVDNRFENGKSQVVSRIGLSADCTKFDKNENLLQLYAKQTINNKIDVIIVDECQFLTKDQVNQLKDISSETPVLCYGLLTNFKTELFEGSKRLIELADSISEIKSICKCGKKATINVRLLNGKVETDGEEVVIGAEETYESMCYSCYKSALQKQQPNISSLTFNFANPSEDLIDENFLESEL